MSQDFDERGVSLQEGGSPETSKVAVDHEQHDGSWGPALAEAEPWVVKDHAGVRVGLLAISMNWLNLAGLSTNMANPDKLAEWTDEVEVPEVDFFLGDHEHIYQETDRYVIAGYDFEISVC